MSEMHRLVADRYQLLRKIGGGGMGRVWLARDQMLQRDVAVKEVMLPYGLSEAERDELCERTLREARTAGRLNHPNVVAIYDVVQSDGQPWIVMEYVPSRSLFEVIKEDGPLPPARAAEIGLHILAALRAAHRAGVWHRDVKPGNVLLADDGRVVLTDFGLATVEGDGVVTASGLILGSAQYISPERARGAPSGPEADMWSLGATLYTAVEGRSPYARESAMATLTALATEPPDTPQRAGPLRPVLIGLLRKNPRHRMRAGEAETLLRRVAAGQTKGMGGRRAIPLQRKPVPADAAGGVPAIPGAAQTGAALALAAPADGTSSRAGLATPARPVDQMAAPARHGRQRVWGVVAVVAALAAVGVAVAVSGLPGPTAAPPASAAGSSAPARVLTPLMGVQACLDQLPANESALSVTGPQQPNEPALPEAWGYYRDPMGFRIGVPATWRLSRIGALTCFRDPTSRRASAVMALGVVSGEPAQLLAAGEAQWLSAAQLVDYRRVAITDLHLTEGGADLEYTYQQGDLVMHGENRMLRLGGQVFVLYWLTTGFAWLSDRALRDVMQPSFGYPRAAAVPPRAPTTRS